MLDGAVPPLRRFELIGLHGYKNIRLDFQGQAKIVIAENGAGKTIFLSALDAFLSRNFLKLSSIQFERVECELAGEETPLILHRSQLLEITDETLGDLRQFAEHANVSINDVHDAILQYDGGELREAPILHRVYLGSPWTVAQTQHRIRLLRTALDRRQSDEVKQISSKLKTALGATEVLFLPTYRRIELSILKHQNRRPVIREARLRTLEALEQPFEEHRTMGINYGLADVEARLQQLTEFIQQRSNLGYRQISAEIIDDLLAGRFASGDWEDDSLPDKDSLRLFFSRIEPSQDHAKQRLEAIDQLYISGLIKEETNVPLRYFLARLSKVVNQTKEVEADIENFVQISNEYLSRSSDQKLLRYDAIQMKVKVVNVWTDSEIRLDDLSSGEKQVISLFAHLYLSQKQKIVLIDEPELSLSIEWQRRLLPDVVHSPTCRQLLAITHSPFVFENELDPCASPLDVTRTKRSGISS